MQERLVLKEKQTNEVGTVNLSNDTHNEVRYLNAVC